MQVNKALPAGTVLYLDGKRYTLEAMTGSGGSCLFYSAKKRGQRPPLWCEGMLPSDSFRQLGSCKWNFDWNGSGDISSPGRCPSTDAGGGRNQPASSCC